MNVSNFCLSVKINLFQGGTQRPLISHATTTARQLFQGRKAVAKVFNDAKTTQE